MGSCSIVLWRSRVSTRLPRTRHRDRDPSQRCPEIPRDYVFSIYRFGGFPPLDQCARGGSQRCPTADWQLSGWADLGEDYAPSAGARTGGEGCTYIRAAPRPHITARQLNDPRNQGHPVHAATNLRGRLPGMRGVLQRPPRSRQCGRAATRPSLRYGEPHRRAGLGPDSRDAVPRPASPGGDRYGARCHPYGHQRHPSNDARKPAPGES
jgi:hypothetical protein